MNTNGLQQFMQGNFLTILSFGVIMLILRDWKGAQWQKILSSIVIALLINDFAVNQGKGVFGLVRWVFSLFGVHF
ncbi:hypothetical protein [Enterococcus faecalis]|uniref:hypothetical protein n=1 Tax=Enterococcus faecalis TaxID=1351 RepID=UPI0025AFC3EA|nr:hypothetical protein [Enterococcus faecalis]MDN3196693.1 hypothetical protein [Enterococcus faecalis]